jgi:hypothetical protein
MNSGEIYEVTHIQKKTLILRDCILAKNVLCVFFNVQVQAFQFVGILYIIITTGDLVVSQ